MCSWDIIEDMIHYSGDVYPPVDISESKKKFKNRTYELMILYEIVEHCCDRMFNDPVDILEMYEIEYVYISGKYSSDSVYKIQLNVIRKLLLYLRKRRKIYG